MKNIDCIIIHGCPGVDEKSLDQQARTYDKHWMPWVKDQLQKINMTAEIPLMPEPWSPDYDAFAEEFGKLPVSQNTVLVGHSCGCAFLVRWLGQAKPRIKKLILVAPWKIADGSDKSKQNFYDFPIDGKIKDRVGEIIMFTSDDEEPDGKKSLEIFHGSLGGKIINLPGHGHYTMGDMKTQEFPELVQAIVG